MNRSCSLDETLSITVAVLRHLRTRKSFISEVWASKVDVVMMVPSELSWPPQNRCEGVPFHSKLWLPTPVCRASLSTYGTLTCSQHTLYCARDTLMGCCELLKPLCNQFLKTVTPKFC